MQLQLISSLTKAMNSVNQVEAADLKAQQNSPIGTECINPQVTYAPRRVIHPEPRYEIRPVYHPTPRIEPIPICPQKNCDPCAPSDPITAGPQPPWKTLPWQQPAPIPPQIKIIIRQPDITSRGTLIDFFC
jgi:hypothetical protein